MKELTIKYGLGGGLTALSFLFGGMHAMLIASFCAIALDYVSALIVCGYHGKLNSSVGRHGAYSKMMYLILIGCGHLLDFVLGTDYVMAGVCVFIISNEILSIIENCGRIPGFKIPKVLRNAIQILNEREDDKK